MLYIATLAEAKADLEITDPQDDAALTRWMETLQGRFDAHLQRTLLRGVNVTEYFNGGGTRIWLERSPVESVASVHVDNDRAWGADTVKIENTDFKVDYSKGSISYGILGATEFADGSQNIRVIYTGGYAAGAVPEGIRGAFLIQLGYEWRNRRDLGRQGLSAQGANLTLAPADLLPLVKNALASFKRFL